MKNLTIKSLELRNFKGEVSRRYDFTHLTVFRGTNQTGKSTVVDAWSWLLTGKDVSGKSDTNPDFEIKHKTNGVVADKIEVSVKAEIEVGNETFVIERQLKEKWVKPRNSEFEEFAGNETVYLVDNVPQKTKRDWDTFIENIIPSELFTLLSNPLAFNNLAWEVRRSKLEALVTIPNTDEVCSLMERGVVAKELIASLKSNETVDSKRKALNQEISTIKKHIDTFAPRFDEINRNIEAEKLVDYSEIEKAIAEKEAEIKILDTKINNYAKAQEDVFALIENLNKKKQSLMAERYQFVSADNELLQGQKTHLQDEKNKLTSEIAQLNQSLSDNTCKVNTLNTKLTTLRESFKNVQAEAYTVGVCPTCQRAYDEAENSEYKFNSEKANRLQKINAEGVELKNTLETLNKERSVILNDLNQKTTANIAIQESINAIHPLSPNPRIAEIDAEIEKINTEISGIKVERSEQDVIDKERLTGELKQLLISSGGKTNVTNLETRKAELQKELDVNNAKLTELQGIEYTLKQYQLKYYELIESRVNSLFKLCKFSFYRELNNGEIEQRCVCTVGGIIYHSVNTANKVNAGLEIINVLSSHYDMSCPIMIDNAESVVSYIPTVAQLSLFIVDETKKVIELTNL